ncbi:MAG: hypothetical protein KKD64_10380 [Alphaproteobacteria bacterium]|nr:hypothetical protein [Alphaproteobacteria bacterium]MBU0795555.1 hypothetical protein [Alphaproteobacteria bacterium]MBU0874642.1 hypothetical protein [Alphaproteobacteria bacterium]MBU1770050.1 hypothetical protein [Alphaproteobacteria bacterium]
MNLWDLLGYVGIAIVIGSALAPAMRRKPKDPLAKYPPDVLGFLAGYAALYVLNHATKDEVARELANIPLEKRSLHTWLRMPEKDRLLLGQRQIALQESPAYQKVQAANRVATERLLEEMFTQEERTRVTESLSKPWGCFKVPKMPE